MAIRKSMTEEFTMKESLNVCLDNCMRALNNADFTKIKANTKISQISAEYKKFTVWGEILITVTENSSDKSCQVNIKTTSNVDNIYALFKSPNKTIIEAFKSNL